LPEEVEAMRSAIKQSRGRHAHRDATLILLICRHGLRVAELASLRWEQIDFNGGTIYRVRVAMEQECTRLPEKLTGITL